MNHGPMNAIVALGFVVLFFVIACLWEWARDHWWR